MEHIHGAGVDLNMQYIFPNLNCRVLTYPPCRHFLNLRTCEKSIDFPIV